MQPYVIQVRDRIRDIIRIVYAKHPNVEVQVGVVAYKDGSVQSEVIGFTQDLQTVEAYIEKLKYEGGDDYAEDVKSGLEAALRMQWDAKYSIIVHIADAPSHGDFYKGILAYRVTKVFANTESVVRSMRRNLTITISNQASMLMVQS